MILTITTTHNPATDLGYLLAKHPAKAQVFKQNFGTAHVFYAEATAEKCTAVLLLEIDSIKLVRRGGKRQAGFSLQQYVNNRPYVASSFLSVAIADVFRTALNGRCKDKPELVKTAIPLTAKIGALPCRGGEAFLRDLFEPLGYTLIAEQHPLDPKFPEWGNSKIFTVELRHTIKLSELLSHLYVLIPVLDDEKHYWVGEHEVEKLLAKGGNWLAVHPQKEEITRRYLKRRRGLVGQAMAQLNREEATDKLTDAEKDAEETVSEKKIGLHQQRLMAVVDALKESGAHSVLDLGCGEGKLLRKLLKEPQFVKILGMDVSYQALQIAADKLKMERWHEKQKERLQLVQSSLMYRDGRFQNYDAAAVVEVIEHLDPPRLAAFEKSVFKYAQPKTVVVTTPNSEYNVMWPSLPAGKFRHRDHRFEWTRAEFKAWADGVAEEFGYEVEIRPLGPEDEAVGAPSQMGIFRKAEG